MKNPVITRPIQMFAIEFSAAFVMVLLVPGDKGFDLFTKPLIAGAAAGIAGFGIGLYEKQLLAKEYGPAGPVISGSASRPKKKRQEKKEEEVETRPQPVIRAIGAQPSAGPQVSPGVAGRRERTAFKTSLPPAASAQPAAHGQASTGSSLQPEQTSPTVAGDKLPAWMEKAMAQAKLSQEGVAPPQGTSGDEELTQKQLRAQLEQPVNLGMPVKAVPTDAASLEGASSIDDLVGIGTPSRSSADTRSQIDSLLADKPSGQVPAKPSEVGGSIQVAVVHPDPDHRRHISSMLAGIGLSIVLETDSEEGALLGLLDTNADVIITALDELSHNPFEYVAKLRKASQFALIVGYGDRSYERIREIAAVWTPGGPVPPDLARMLGI